MSSFVKKLAATGMAVVMTAAVAVTPTFAAIGGNLLSTGVKAAQTASRVAQANSFSPRKADGYWSSQFSQNGQTAYMLIVDAIKNGKTSVAIPSVNQNERAKFWNTISWEHPELFYAKNFGSSSHNENNVTTYTEHWSLDSNWQSEKSAVEQAANKFLANAPKSGSDYDKELYVHDKLANETTYQLGKDNIYYSLVQKQGNCMGYSYAMKYLLNKLGVTCRTVIGKGVNPETNGQEDHMWNVVTLNGKEYLTDACWDSTTKISKTLPHYYFNLTKDEMNRDHIPNVPSEENNCTNSDQNYYKKNGMYYSSVADAEKAIKKNLKKGQEMAVMLPSQSDAEKVSNDFMSAKIFKTGSFSANKVVNQVVILKLN